MASHVTFDGDHLVKVLASGLTGADYTQVFSEIFKEGDRVVYMVHGGASANFAFNVTIATNAAGASPTDLLATPIVIAAGKVYTIEIGPGALTEAKQFVSPKLVSTAGLVNLFEIRTRLRTPGEYTQDTTYGSATHVFN